MRSDLTLPRATVINRALVFGHDAARQADCTRIKQPTMRIAPRALGRDPSRVRYRAEPRDRIAGDPYCVLFRMHFGHPCTP